MIKKEARIINEFMGVDFGDKRLNVRFNSIIESLGATPAGIISKAFIDAKDQKAAYRFFENEKTSIGKMLSAHQERLRERCRENKKILAVQDSTAVHLPGAEYADEIGKIGDLKCAYPGLNVHTTLCLTPSGVPIGIGDLQIYERNLVKRTKRREQIPAEEKESGRWLRALINARKAICPDTDIVWIADREGDFWDYFTLIRERNELFVQRVVHDRKISESSEKYFRYVSQSQVIGTHVFDVERRGGRNGRETRRAICEIRTEKVTLKKPEDLSRRKMKEMEVQIIHVREIGKEPLEAPLEWFLVTNIFCATSEEVLEKIRWYCLRWTIEELHKTVKSGCQVEEMRLGNKSKLEKLLLLLFIIAMRIVWISKLANRGEESMIPCTAVFSDEEWKVIYMRRKKEEPPQDYVPTLSEMVRWVSALGGFQEYNKKRDPGIMTLWRGLRRLSEMIAALELFVQINLQRESSKY